MAIDFKKIAIQEMTLSPLMLNRTQIKTEDLVGQEATIMEFDFAHITDKGEEKIYPVMLLNEYPDKYYNGGSLMMKLCTAWAASCNGDVETASEALKKSGGVKVRFRASKTRSGNNLTTVDIL